MKAFAARASLIEQFGVKTEKFEEEKEGVQLLVEYLLKVDKPARMYQMEQNQGLCTELKQLYVACTRARKRLIFFDSDAARREPIMKLWSQLGVVEPITEQDVYGAGEGQEQQQSGERKFIARVAAETSTEAWKVQGVRMFKRKFYEAALHCFKKAKEPELERRAKAYVLAEAGSRLQGEAEEARHEIDPTIDSKKKVQEARARAQQLEHESRESFGQAGEIFAMIGLRRQSAQCFYSSGRYREAAGGFKEIGFHAQAAECEVFCQNYSVAGELYLLAGVHLKAIEMMVKAEKWERVLQIIKEAKAALPEKEIITLVNHYTPLAL